MASLSTKDTLNLGYAPFRKAYKQLLEAAKNNKNKTDQEWKHKSLCFYHDYYPMAREFFDEHCIPETHWKMCQCGIYETSIEKHCGAFKYRIGLEEIVDQGEGSQKNAHYANIEIIINRTHRFHISLLSAQAGEIKKLLQPATRKKKLATGTFSDGKFILQLADKYYIQWKVKKRYQKSVTVHAEQSRNDIADFWYENWSVHGLYEDKDENLNTKLFVALHNNRFIEGTSREACERRIVLYAYSLDGEDFELTINGKRPKTREECEQRSKSIQRVKKATAHASTVSTMSQLDDTHHDNTSFNSSFVLNASESHAHACPQQSSLLEAEIESLRTKNRNQEQMLKSKDAEIEALKEKNCTLTEQLDAMKRDWCHQANVNEDGDVLCTPKIQSQSTAQSSQSQTPSLSQVHDLAVFRRPNKRQKLNNGTFKDIH